MLICGLQKTKNEILYLLHCQRIGFNRKNAKRDTPDSLTQGILKQENFQKIIKILEDEKLNVTFARF